VNFAEVKDRNFDCLSARDVDRMLRAFLGLHRYSLVAHLLSHVIHLVNLNQFAMATQRREESMLRLRIAHLSHNEVAPTFQVMHFEAHVL
jgi:hypothetical protein